MWLRLIRPCYGPLRVPEQHGAGQRLDGNDVVLRARASGEFVALALLDCGSLGRFVGALVRGDVLD
jgi:hypothetical protein